MGTLTAQTGYLTLKVLAAQVLRAFFRSLTEFIYTTRGAQIVRNLLRACLNIPDQFIDAVAFVLQAAFLHQGIPDIAVKLVGRGDRHNAGGSSAAQRACNFSRFTVQAHHFQSLFKSLERALHFLRGE